MVTALMAIKPSDLPVPPQAALKIMQACSQGDTSNQELADLASTDPVLTAELLRVVNSPFFGQAGEISSIQRAITMLGHRALRNLVLCLSVRDVLQQEDIPGFDMTAFWEDTLRRATVGRKLASLASLDEDDCFTVCLLQDFGLLVMFYLKPEAGLQWADLVLCHPEERRAKEMEIFDVTHDQVSNVLAEKWHLPETFVHAIAHHHDCSLEEDGTPAMRLCNLLHCADWMAALFNAEGKAHILQQIHAKLRQYLDSDEQQNLAMLNEIPELVEQAAHGLGLDIDVQENFDQILRDANMTLAEENLSYQELTWKLEKALKERDDLAEALASELELAAEIQRSLLPKNTSQVFPVYGVNLSARELSGDFFDYFQAEDGSVNFCIGDVSGKGVTASLLMAKTSSLFHCLGKTECDPGKLMSILNREICETSVRGMFVSMVAGNYNPETTMVRMVNAGSPPVLYLEGKILRQTFDAVAPPLGVVNDTRFPVTEFDLGKGHLLMFSDGVTEGYVEEGKELGLLGLIDLIETGQEMLPRNQLLNVLNRFVNARVRQRDDITIMLLENCGRGSVKLFNYEFHASPEQLQIMREKVRGVLEKLDCRKLIIDQLVLAVNEAVMNVIQHAYGDIVSGLVHIEIIRKTDDLIFRITDFATPVDPESICSRDLEDIRPGGLGVHFMQELMDDVRFQKASDHEGNVLSMRKRLDASCIKK